MRRCFDFDLWCLGARVQLQVSGVIFTRFLGDSDLFNKNDLGCHIPHAVPWCAGVLSLTCGALVRVCSLRLLGMYLQGFDD